MWTLQNHLVANWAVIVLFLKHFKWFTLNKKSHYNKLKSLIKKKKKKKKKVTRVAEIKREWPGIKTLFHIFILQLNTFGTLFLKFH